MQALAIQRKRVGLGNTVAFNQEKHQKTSINLDTTQTLDLITGEAAELRVNLTKLRWIVEDAQQFDPDPECAEQVHDANKQLLQAALHAQIIAEAAISKLDELERRSQLDVLTETPNRALMRDRLDRAIALASRNRTHIAVLFLDLDHFKQINDTLGHAVGDTVIQIAAKRLESVVRDSDTVSRHGGDEFLVLLGELAQPSDATLIARKMLAVLAAPCHVGAQSLCLSASIGVTIYPKDGKDAATLISRADKAMYVSKSRGGGCFELAR